MEEKVIAIERHQINHLIRDKEVRVIDENGQQLGIMSATEANRIADEKNLDLVKISPNSNPPVCKIMNYGKFRFDQTKKEKDNRKNQKINEMKEIWLSMTIEAHDLATKAKITAKFLAAGDRVKVSIRMRGRQQARPEMGVKVMDEFYKLLEDVSVIEKKPLTEGRSILMILAPKQ